MMSWHDYLALALFTVSAAVVAARAYRSFFVDAKTGCGGGCGSCGSTASAATSEKLISIEPLSAEARH